MRCKYAKTFANKYNDRPFRCIYDESCKNKIDFAGIIYCGKEMANDPLGELEVIYERLEKIIKES